MGNAMWGKGDTETRGCREKTMMLHMWKCPKGRKERREEAAPLHKVWEKIREHCGAKGSPPQGAVMSMEGWTMK